MRIAASDDNNYSNNSNNSSNNNGGSSSSSSNIFVASESCGSQSITWAQLFRSWYQSTHSKRYSKQPLLEVRMTQILGSV